MVKNGELLGMGVEREVMGGVDRSGEADGWEQD